MQTVSFLSSHPFDHVQRGLDILRKMHFGLVRLSVEPSGSAFLVEITFQQRGDLAADIFLDRLAQLDGLVFQPALAGARTESRACPRPPKAAAAPC